MRAAIRLLASATTLVALVACTSSTTGSPQPRPAGDASARPANTFDEYGAPRVTHPLDTTRWQADPCTTLTPAQLPALGITRPGRVVTDPKGNFCDWSPQPDVEYTLGFNTGFDPSAPKGLANLYQTAGAAQMVRLPDIAGVIAVTEPIQNTAGSCTVYLGATDVITYAVSVNILRGLPQYSDPCTPAQRLALDVTRTMTSG